jgi:hypothetical protein
MNQVQALYFFIGHSAPDFTLLMGIRSQLPCFRVHCGFSFPRFQAFFQREPRGQGYVPPLFLLLSSHIQEPHVCVYIHVNVCSTLEVAV